MTLPIMCSFEMIPKSRLSMLPNAPTAKQEEFILTILYLCRPPMLRMSMKKLSWLKVGQHQFQKNVTHRLTLVLVDGRDNECVFSCLIGVFLLAVTSSIASSTKLLAQSIPCFVSDCRGHVSTPKSRGYRKSNRELPFPAFGASFLRFFRLFLNFIHYTTKSLFWTFPYEKVAIPNWNSYFQSTYGN